MRTKTAFGAGVLAGVLSVLVLVTVHRFAPVVLSGAAQAPQAATSPIHGVWRVVEQTISGRTLSGSDLGLGFYIYTARHYTVVRESGTPPRLDVEDANTATAAQLLAAWGPFVAQFGTYEVSGDLVTERIVVAKEPANMRPDRPGSVRRYRLDGNTLTTEPSTDSGGRMITLKMVRVE